MLLWDGSACNCCAKWPGCQARVLRVAVKGRLLVRIFAIAQVLQLWYSNC